MNKQLILISILLWFIGCKPSIDSEKPLTPDVDENIVSYYENGTVKHKGKYFKKIKIGKHEWFYENGEKKVIANYINDTLTGFYKTFYNNGVLKVEANYEKGKTIGNYFIYNDSGLLIEERNYYLFRGEEFSNTWIIYDENEKVKIKESHFFEVLNKKNDNLYVKNEIFNLKFLIHPFNNYKISYILGEFDDSFNLSKIDNKERFFPEKFSFSVKLKTSKLGKNTLRFIVDDYKEDVLTKAKTVKPILIEYNYEVVD